jgi:hypothetical protein
VPTRGVVRRGIGSVHGLLEFLKTLGAPRIAAMGAVTSNHKSCRAFRLQSFPAMSWLWIAALALLGRNDGRRARA